MDLARAGALNMSRKSRLPKLTADAPVGQPSATFSVVGQEAAVVPTKGSVVRRGAHESTV